MANIKSAKKRIKVTEVKTAQNRMIKSALKTTIKKFEAAVAAKNVEEAQASFVKAAVEAKNNEEAKALYTSVVKSLDMAASKGVVHKNMAARKKSRLAAKLNALA